MVTMMIVLAVVVAVAAQAINVNNNMFCGK